MSRVAYLGPENTNTYFAALAKFGKKSRYLHAPTIEDVFHLVEREKAEYGVVPVENSLEGSIAHTLDRFVDFKRSPVRICGELEQPINHYLIMPKGTAPEKIRVVYSHPQALAQCRDWLLKHYPYATRRERSSTAEAVNGLFDQEERLWDLDERAAIGRIELVDKRRLKAVPIRIDQENITRFFVIALRQNRRSGSRSKTSLMFALQDRPGALHSALEPFKRYGINLTKIESRPSRRRAWEYVFFVDFEGHESDPRVKRALSDLQRYTSTSQVLGSYPVEKL
ncbi:MAG: prephenate dehydratase [Candidatus Omnitrophica bacterium]|nr:prephenate dehydratase [Candidatus Omnitrophota bacterium]